MIVSYSNYIAHLESWRILHQVSAQTIVLHVSGESNSGIFHQFYRLPQLSLPLIPSPQLCIYQSDLLSRPSCWWSIGDVVFPSHQRCLYVDNSRHSCRNMFFTSNQWEHLHLGGVCRRGKIWAVCRVSGICLSCHGQLRYQFVIRFIVAWWIAAAWMAITAGATQVCASTHTELEHLVLAFC